MAKSYKGSFLTLLFAFLMAQGSFGGVHQLRNHDSNSNENDEYNNSDVKPVSVSNVNANVNKSSNSINPICLQPKIIGPCRARIPKFHFNVQTNKCEDFFYGGCEGNGNNFETRAECEISCELDVLQQTKGKICTGPAETGPMRCMAMIQRWTFNTSSKQCEPTTYGGCGATSNNFETQLDCQMTCGDVSHCSLDKDPGLCYGTQQVWWYNKEKGECQEFNYGGCGGNRNKFQSRHECEKSCRPEGQSRIQSRGYNCDDVKCPGGTSHYKALGCVPIYEDGACCPTSFDCPDRKLERNSSNQCVYGGKLYNPGEYIAAADSGSGCRAGCTCTTNGIACAHVDCPSYFGYYPKEGCRIGLYRPGECCPYDWACGNETITCNFEGKTYFEGEKMYPKEVPCKKCYCKVGFNGTLSDEFCEEIDCGIQVFYSKELERGCTPVYFQDSESRIGCCPISWKCPSEKEESHEEIIPNNTNNTLSVVDISKSNGTDNIDKFEVIFTGANDTFRIVKDKSVEATASANNDTSGIYNNNDGPLPHNPGNKLPRVNRGQPGVQTNSNSVYPSVQNSVDICTLPKAIGDCRAIRRRYFSNGNGTCEEFIYSGCRGNANNFETLTECKATCGPERDLRGRFGPSPSASTPKNTDPCTEPVNSGRCRAFFPRYFFDVTTNRCQFFIFGGCQRNANNFYSKESCEATCLKTYPNICESLPIDLTKDCGGGNSTKYYYDSEAGYCKRVVSSGCGSPNIFNRLVECDSVCGGGKGGIPRWRNSMSESPVSEKEKTCHLPKKVGPCFASIPAFYYDVTSQSCQNFTYSGCFGNLNRFESLDSCRDYCEPESNRNLGAAAIRSSSNSNWDGSSIAFNELPQVEDPNVIRGQQHGPAMQAPIPIPSNSNPSPISSSNDINRRPQIQSPNMMRRGVPHPRPHAQVIDDDTITRQVEGEKRVMESRPQVEDPTLVQDRNGNKKPLMKDGEAEEFIFARMANNKNHNSQIMARIQEAQESKRNATSETSDDLFFKSQDKDEDSQEDLNVTGEEPGIRINQKPQVEDLNVLQKESSPTKNNDKQQLRWRSAVQPEEEQQQQEEILVQEESAAIQSNSSNPVNSTENDLSQHKTNPTFTVTSQRPQIQPPIRPNSSPVISKSPQKDRRKEICSDELSVGTCNQTLLRFYWDSKTLSCRPFNYTGCSGNKNHFTTELDCRQTCDDNYQDVTKTYCQFGSQKILFGQNLGESDGEKCGVEFCTCIIPPSLTCTVKACPTNIFEPIMTPTTTTTSPPISTALPLKSDKVLTSI